MAHSDPSYSAGGPDHTSFSCLPVPAPGLQHTDSLMSQCAQVPIHCDYFIMLAVELQQKRQQYESQPALRSDSTLNFHRRGALVMSGCSRNKPALLSRRTSQGLFDDLAAVPFLPFVGQFSL